MIEGENDYLGGLDATGGSGCVFLSLLRSEVFLDILSMMSAA